MTPKNHYDVIMTSLRKYLVFKIAKFVELDRRYQLVKFHWPRLSGSNFTRACRKHPQDITRSQKAQSLYRVKSFSKLLYVGSFYESF